MAKLLNRKPEIVERAMRPINVSPLPPRFVVENALLRDELERLKQRLSELEERMSGEKVVMIRDITREEAKREIKKLFSSGRTLYYSDIVQELKLDLETVVDICNELQESKEIAVDASVS